MVTDKKIKDEEKRKNAHSRLEVDINGDGIANADLIIEAIFENKKAKKDLYKKICSGSAADFDKSMVDDALRWVMNGQIPAARVNAATIDTWKKKIVAKTKGQHEYLALLRSNEVVFGLGPAGLHFTHARAEAGPIICYHAGSRAGSRD